MNRRGHRRASEPKLLGAAEAAERLGVMQSNLRRQVGLPEPYDTIRATTLWRATDIEAFRQKRERRGAEEVNPDDDPVAAAA